MSKFCFGLVCFHGLSVVELVLSSRSSAAWSRSVCPPPFFFVAETRLRLYLVHCWCLHCIWPSVPLPALVSCLRSPMGALISHLLAALVRVSMLTLSLKTSLQLREEDFFLQVESLPQRHKVRRPAGSLSFPPLSPRSDFLWGPSSLLGGI